MQRPGHPVHCPLFCHPSTAKAHPCNNWNVFLTFSKSIIYTLCCTLGCLSALLWFWHYLRKSQSRWACREQGDIHTWTDILQQGDYWLILEKNIPRLSYLLYISSDVAKHWYSYLSPVSVSVNPQKAWSDTACQIETCENGIGSWKPFKICSSY